MIELNTIRIKDGFSWNGSSFVLDDKIVLGRPITWIATCVRNLLYKNRNPLTRVTADILFYRELVKAEIKLAFLYFIGMRVFGWMVYKGSMK